MTQTHYERQRFPQGARIKAFDPGLLDRYLATGRQIENFPFEVMAGAPETSDPETVAHGFTQALRMGISRLLSEQSAPYSYSMLCKDRRYVALYDMMLAMGPKDIVQPSFMTDYHGLTFERAGKRTYDVHPDLGERLSHTELRGLTADDLRLPYEAIYIVVPPTANLKVWNVETQWHRVEGVYVVEDSSMKMGDDQGDLSGPDIRGWRILVCGEPKGMMHYGGISLPDDALSYFRVLLPEGRSLDACVAETVREIERSVKSGTGTWDANMTPDWEQHFRWVMNAVLYATWEEPGEHWEANREARQLWDRIQKTPKGRKRDNLLQKAKGVERQPRLRLGYKIKVQRHGPDPMPTERSGAFREGMGVRTRVAGHWRKQAHGPGRTERKLIWIEPHWRNLDGEVPVEEPMHVMK